MPFLSLQMWEGCFSETREATPEGSQVASLRAAEPGILPASTLLVLQVGEEMGVSGYEEVDVLPEGEQEVVST